ncbi:MAG: polysaccharide biosynthesis tyrosine autokinase [Deltaproteobacteria bacterium]|nr:polysaccharide biosynthesis tyrosine autokinase [Deltaproteobacteria bacterium]
MAQYDINLREYWRILKKRKAVVIIIAIALGTFSTLFSTFRAPPPLYTATCSIKFEKQTTVEGLYARTISWSDSDDMETQISILNSFSVFQRVAEEMCLIPKGTVKREFIKPRHISIIEGLQSKVKVSREGFTNIINISASNGDPAFAQRLANTVARTYKAMHAEQQMKRTAEALKYIADQLKKVRQKLKESEEEFNRFTQENQIISFELQSENLLQRKQEIRQEIRNVRDARRELEVVLERLTGFIKNPVRSGMNFYSSRADEQYRSTNGILVELLLKRDTLLEDFTSKHPEVVAISRKIIETARKMKILLQLDLRDLEKKEQSLFEELEALQERTNDIMEKKLEYDRLKRKVDLYHDMTALLEEKNQEALIRKAEKPEEITIVKPALLPAAPVNPPKTAATAVLGIVIGLVIGLVSAFIVEAFDTSLGAIEDVEQTIGAQVLGVIPHSDVKEIMGSLKAHVAEELKNRHLLQTPHLASHYAPKSMMAESFRALRTNVQFKFAEKRIKSVVVTSTSPQEGKTLVSTNLAITMAQAGVKTLLVGADMRKPVMGKVFGLENAPGLAEVILGNHPWRDTVKSITDIIMGKMSLDEVMLTPGLDNLNIITSGNIPPNPAELMESRRFDIFLEEAKKEYDLIVFDSPPIVSTADASIVASKMDGVVLVYRVGAVSRVLLKRAKAQLEQIGCNLIGVVLNGMKPEISPDFKDYYKYYYSYRVVDGKKNKGFPGKGLFRGWRSKERPTDLDQEWHSERLEKPSEVSGKKKGPLRSVLLLIALVILALGLLWHNGMIDPGEWLSSEKPPTKKEPPKPLVKRSLLKGEIKTRKTGRGEPPAMGGRPEEKERKGEKREEQGTTPEVKLQGAERELGKEPTLSPEGSHGLGVVTQVPVPEKEPLYPYSLYLGSFRNIALAKKAKAFYGKKGIGTYWAKVRFKGKGVWYRVFTGYFRSPGEAEEFKEERGLQEAEVKMTRYANLVGTFERDGELEARVKELESMGLTPYVIRRGAGKAMLLVGAYVTKEGAEGNQKDLQLKGIISKVVER